MMLKLVCECGIGTRFYIVSKHTSTKYAFISNEIKMYIYLENLEGIIMMKFHQYDESTINGTFPHVCHSARCSKELGITSVICRTKMHDLCLIMGKQKYMTSGWNAWLDPFALKDFLGKWAKHLLGKWYTGVLFSAFCVFLCILNCFKIKINHNGSYYNH